MLSSAFDYWLLQTITAFRTFVSMSVNVTQFGIGVVFLLLAAKNIDDFCHAIFAWRISFCIMILVVAAILLPLTMLKSPQDFWYVHFL